MRPLRAATLALIMDDADSVLVKRRPPNGIWGGLLSVPEFDADLSDAELLQLSNGALGCEAWCPGLEPRAPRVQSLQFRDTARVVRVTAAWH